MLVAVDAMGGDNAPEAPVLGAYMAAEEYDTDILLIGDEEKIEKIKEKHQLKNDRVKVLHTTEVILMEDSPVMAIRRKKDSSMVKGLELLKEKQVDVFISAGSTGAFMAGAYFKVRCIEGIKRPALAVIMPTLSDRRFLLLDSGANMDADVNNLVQYAIMGSLYCSHVLGIKKPAVALANVGTEEEKGNKVVKETYQKLKTVEEVHFIGNVEARDVPMGACDVLVCDGFVGNTILKMMEGMAMGMFSALKKSFMQSTKTKIAASMLKPALKELKGRMDYTEYGGAPLLGIQGACIKAHGSSDAKSIKNAVNQGMIFVENRVVELIASEVKKYIDTENKNSAKEE